MLKQVWRDKVEMILKGLVNVSELARHAKCDRTRYFRNQYKGKTINIAQSTFIPKVFLTSKRDKEAAMKCTVLDDYLPLSYCSEYLLDETPCLLRRRIKFQNATKQKLFETKKVNTKVYIKIPEELQKKMKYHVCFAIKDFNRFHDYDSVKDMYIFGGYVIVFV